MLPILLYVQIKELLSVPLHQIQKGVSSKTPHANVILSESAQSTIFHTAAGQEGLTGFSQSSTNPDMIAVYPQGVNGYWQGAPYSTAGVDDVAFTKQMLIALQSQFCVDTNRLYATGMSNGGGFTGTLACDNSASQIFAAFGAHSGAFYPGSAYPDNASCNSSTVPVTCNPGRQHIPFLEIHGNNDGQIPYTGGGHNGQCLPAIPYYMTYKATQEGYGSTNTTTQLGNGNVMYTWGTSANGIAGVVQHVMVNGLGHSWASNFNGFTSSPVVLSFLKQWNLSAAV
jgi:poly(3-hydroxybutyrate) depolymerase